MNCNYHQDSRIELICVASHKCQRKLCSQCEHQEEYSTHDARLFEQFHKSLLKQLDESNLEEKNDFKQDLSDIESMLQKIKEELSKIIAEICYNIDQKNEYYLNVTNETTNLAEQSYVKLEELLEIHQGTLLDDWKCEKQFYLGQMKDMIQFSQKEITTLSERLNQKIICFREFQKIGQKCFVWKEDLYEVLALTKDINSNDEIFNVILQSIKKQDKTPLDYCFFNSIKKKFKEEINFYNHDLTEIQKQTKLKNKNNDIQIIAHVIKNIRELEFYKMNYSLQDFQETRKILIQQIENDEKIMKFLIFLVKLTSFDEKFIQCGSNSLNLLVEMKADLRGQCFNNIRIQDTLLIRANFARCNLSNSQFINVNISGINVNQAQLIGCKWRNLKINELIKLQGHKNSIQSVCFSPDGKTLASASDDKSIILWDVKTVQQIAKLNGHSNPVRSVCFSHDGATLASGSGYPIYNFENDSDDYSIRLWDVKTGQQKAKLNGHCNCVYQVCFSPNRRILASCSDDRTIRLWDIEKQKQIAKLEGHYNGVQSVSFSPDGSNLASGSYDKSVRLWDPRTGQQKAILNGHQDDVMSVCFSPDGTTLASASKDKSVRLWDVKTGEQKAKLDGHSSYVMSVNFSSDGATLASGSRDHSIRLWDVKTGQQTVNLEASSIRSVCFSPDGLILASGSYDNSISLWDVRVAQENAKVDGHRNIFQQVCFSSDGNKLYSCSDDKTIRFWDVKKGQQISKLNGLNQNFQFICFPSNGNTIAYICDDHSINLKDVQTEQLIAKLNDYNGTVLSFQISIWQ
ncbi:unnamed protein product (macronuclear) [Paramecium tetraurelia]|uniref:EML-like second beta-propeller domain-containing protein n=1 Tax=Paramecium tetraurelia TaxID=5888 RepID=A0D1X6_PARTE|nr:uncharacterized protein GSPATT00012568001 [Paramecium tetraurelia]CAK77043.1 unnamed protein product [Paramecium tetraurelia]|eukprot:XP_001444440.1 hypothetical protein (macronuclear) [Paramecium tetraurelia strain d4-2]